MVADLLNEQRISLAEAGRRAGNVSPETIWRWRTRGVAGVLLETFKIGGRRYTTVEALNRFTVRSTEVSETESRFKSQSDQRSPLTERRLANSGLL